MLSSDVIPTRRVSTEVFFRGGTAVLEAYAAKYELDAVGTAVWLACDGVRTAQEVAACVAARYLEPVSRCQDDILRFLDELLQADLITTRRSP